MKRIWNDFFHLFFPDLCLLCKEPLTRTEEHLCLSCLCNLPYTYHYKEKENRLYQLLLGKADVREAYAWLWFEKGGMAQPLIHSLKYKENRPLGFHLGRMAALEWKEAGLFTDVDILVPVPLHRKRKRKRGYNQAEEIARGIASVYPVAVYPDLLKKTRLTGSQVKKGFYERWEDHNPFVLTENRPASIGHILVVDDVITSGATISHCVQTLLSIPEITISIASLCQTR